MVKGETFKTAFKFGDKVHIDGDGSLTAVVTGFCFHTHINEVEVSWFNNGEAVSAWFADWRLTEE